MSFLFKRVNGPGCTHVSPKQCIYINLNTTANKVVPSQCVSIIWDLDYEPGPS